MNSYLEVNTIRTIMLDYTTKCNALCLRCARNIDGKYLNKNMPIEDMPWEIFEKFFTETINSLDRIDYCGNFGDPILHPDLIKGIRWLYAKEDYNKRQKIESDRGGLLINIATNGGINSPHWWKELAHALNTSTSNQPGTVTFGIDGLEDTNDLYRRQVNWKRLMENVEAFIQAGGKATWQFIIFEHNAHQLQEVEQLSKEMGFTDFFTIDNYHREENDTGGSNTDTYLVRLKGKKEQERTRKLNWWEDLTTIFNRPTEEVVDHFGLETKKYEKFEINNETEDNITNKKSKLTNFEIIIKTQYNDDINLFEKTAPIKCSWHKNEKAGVLLMWNGEIWPCCYTGGQRYPKDYPWDHPEEGNDFYRKTHGTYGEQFNNINHYTVDEILKHEWYADQLVKSWTNDSRLDLCGVMCTQFK
jgi:MoaA/NifB/PqqE/SkfB family radical SAM enzyme